MNLDEIRDIVARTTAQDWHVLSGAAPTYIGLFLDRDGSLEFTAHERRAVLRRDLDVGLVWGLETDPHGEEREEWWAPELAATPNPRPAYPYWAEVLYRGQPVDRVQYASIDNGYGIVPWPTSRYPSGVDPMSGTRPDLEVTAWERDLAVLLKSLGVSVGGSSVDDYLTRCDIEVI